MTPAGTEEYIKWEMMPWFDENGQVGGVVQFTEFITQARMMRLALEEAKENLELKVQERTRDLEAAVRETEAAQTAKDEFFANITHELRTPLHAIINFSKFGLNKTVNEDGTPGDLQKITGYFADINRSGNRLLLLVDDLLDLTKNKVKAAKLSIKQHSMLELYDEVCSEMSSILEAKNMVMQTAFAVTQPIITCDRQRIHQVLLNLISNAVKFSEPGSAITLILEEGEHYRLKKGLESYIVIAVEDRGIGIPENELESIFDEFKQSSKVMSGKFSKGTGLGLAICRQIIHAHNGFIWAENNPQGGTRLCFALPREFGNVETKKPATKKKGSKAA